MRKFIFGVLLGSFLTIALQLRSEIFKNAFVDVITKKLREIAYGEDQRSTSYANVPGRRVDYPRPFRQKKQRRNTMGDEDAQNEQKDTEVKTTVEQEDGDTSVTTEVSQPSSDDSEE